MRPVRLATASILIDEQKPGYPSPCIEVCLTAIDQAGQAKADLILLPEEPDLKCCSSDKIKDIPEAIPGGSTFTEILAIQFLSVTSVVLLSAIDFYVRFSNLGRERYPDVPSLSVQQLIDRMDRERIDIGVLLPLESPEGPWGMFTHQALDWRSR